MALDPSIIAALCQLPRSYRAGVHSLRDLVAASGFGTIRDSITSQDLRPFLERHADLIDDWIRWSEDKRTREGWYISPAGNGAHVGYVGESEPARYIAPLAEACAQFILHEVRWG